MIPDDLKKLPTWVGWKFEDVGRPKLAKIPKNPLTGRNASTVDPDTWGTFEQALAAQQQYGFDGIGIVFYPPAAPLIGFDLDGCLNGDLTPEAQQVLDTLNSYAEISPSGTGIKIIALGDLPPELGNGTNQQPYEVYKAGRFFTVTGQHYPGTPLTIKPRHAEIDQVCRWLFPKKFEKPDPTPAAPTQPTNLDDLALLNLAMNAKNGDHFSVLWNGQWQGNGWGSQSEADQALCNMICFWAGPDPARIDQLFRQSGLMRDKWDRKTGDSTYGNLTIQRAIDDTKEFYQPGESYQDLLGRVVIGPAPEDEPGTWADLKELFGSIEWDWPLWIARGFQVMIASYAGDGKSSLALHIAKTYLTGCPWPDGSPFTGPTGKILWCEAENGQGMNIDRATSWGLPVNDILTPLSDASLDISLDDPDHQARILHIGQRPDVAAIFVDSLSGGTNSEAKSSNEMGKVGKFLAGVAKVTGKPVIVTHHLNKPNRNFKQDRISLDRVRDSSAIVQYARLVWAIDVPDADIPHQKRLYPIKSNLGRHPDPLGFVITGTGLVFGDAPQPPRKVTELERAATFLRETLQDGPVLASEVLARAEGLGLSERTLKRAKDIVNVMSTKIDGNWHWKKQDPIETIII